MGSYVRGKNKKRLAPATPSEQLQPRQRAPQWGAGGHKVRRDMPRRRTKFTRAAGRCGREPPAARPLAAATAMETAVLPAVESHTRHSAGGQGHCAGKISLSGAAPCTAGCRKRRGPRSALVMGLVMTKKSRARAARVTTAGPAGQLQLPRSQCYQPNQTKPNNQPTNQYLRFRLPLQPAGSQLAARLGLPAGLGSTLPLLCAPPTASQPSL